VFLKMSLRDQDLKTYALLALIGALDLKPIRARIGYLYLAWTPKEAIEKGQMVIVDGSEQINQREAQHYFFTQVYSMIKAELNKMRPGNPKDEPVSIIIYSLL